MRSLGFQSIQFFPMLVSILGRLVEKSFRMVVVALCSSNPRLDGEYNDEALALSERSLIATSISGALS
jgi:hypothetical protein